MVKPITAAGGVVFRTSGKNPDPEVLLIYRNGVWDLPKGKLEKGESIAMCASREVAEETHSELPLIISALGTTYHEYYEKNKKIGKTIYWYSMIFPKEQLLKPQLLEGIERVEWAPIEKAKKKVGFENLKDILISFSEWYSK